MNKKNQHQGAISSLKVQVFILMGMMDAKDLDCLGYVRELRIDDYLSPTTLEEIAEEIKKKVNRG